jgi:hypothetical protein
MKLKLGLLFILSVILVAFVPVLAVTNFGAVHIQDANPTAIPALRVNQQGAGKIVEFSDGGTPVFSINNGGGIVASTILTQGATLNNLIVGQPTAATTATPAALIDSLAAGSNLLEVRDAATPVFTINNGGAWSSTGAGTHSGGQTVNNWGKIAAPTAIATATPAMVVDSLGVSTIFEVRDAATPVFTVNNGGTITGLVLQYGTAGQRVYCNASTFTGTLALTSSTTAIATPVVPWCSLNQDPTGASQTCSTINASGVVTVSVWTSNATPTASEEGAAVSYCIIGTP